MANTNTDHSKDLRQKTAAERRKAIKNDGGKDLSNVLLEKEEVRKLVFLCEWFGSGDKPATQTEVIKKLIAAEYRKNAYKPMFEGDIPKERKTMSKQKFIIRVNGHLLGITEFNSKTPERTTATRLRSLISRKYQREVTVGVIYG